MVIALDPGPVVSGYYTQIDGVAHAGVLPNGEILLLLKYSKADTLAVETLEARGMPLGNESLDTVFWTGRFCQAWTPRYFTRVFRRDVKIALCGTVRAKDANVAAALRDIYGERDTKAHPNPALRGVSSHAWAALAVWHYCTSGTSGHLPPPG